MDGLLKFLGNLLVGGEDTKRREVNKLREKCRPEYGGRFARNPGLLYQTGDRIADRYEVSGMVGRGGFGVVYLALRLPDRTTCALKTFRDEFLFSATSREAFRREASVWVGLGTHPHILEARSVLEYCGRLFVEAEFVSPTDGRISLQDHLKESSGPLDSDRSLEWAVQFCFGMEHAGAHGIRCHQDIKPANILITHEGMLKIADFGLASGAAVAWHTQHGNRGSIVTEGEGGRFGLSLVQVAGRPVCGTPGYIAPEVYRGERGDERSDIYSFGLVLAQMVTGSPMPPFAVQYPGSMDAYLEAIYTQQMSGLLPRLSGPLRKVVGRCLQAEPSGRYRGFRDLRLDLEKIFRERTGRGFLMPGIGEKTPTFWNDRGNNLAALSKYEDALGCYEKALSAEPLSAMIWYNKGACLDKLRRPSEALACFEKALMADPSCSQAWSGKGHYLADLHQHAEAVRCYEKALQINPNDPCVWNNKGLSLDFLHRWQEALASYDRALALDPLDAVAWLNKGTTLQDQGQLTLAIGCFDRALTINPRYAKAWWWKACAEEGLGHLHEAKVSYQNYIAVAPPRSDQHVTFAQNKLRELG